MWPLALLLCVVVFAVVPVCAASLGVVAPDAVELGQPILISATGSGMVSVWSGGVLLVEGRGVVLLQENATSLGERSYVVADEVESVTVVVVVVDPGGRQVVYIAGLPFVFGSGEILPSDVPPVDSFSGPLFQSGASYASYAASQGYDPVYEKGDLPLIVEDGVGTLLSSIVENLPIIIMFVVFSAVVGVVSRVKR